HSVSESQVQHPATWMQAESSSSNEYSLTQPSQKQLSTSSQTAWWQPILQWMIHGKPNLRIAVAVLMVGVVLLLRFASERWQLRLRVKLSFL
ncbi:hypothetical protein VXE63_20510, partial [Acinetobacter nosocomialis]|uniref:hypothetical protein n=1 Tax=Acinetobacter nosocomialis TaxID=106654 RepID=UPI0030FBDEBB